MVVQNQNLELEEKTSLTPRKQYLTNIKGDPKFKNGRDYE